MNKIELLAPAGDFYKACIALKYGADAVYVGGKEFSLRARASNFSIEEITKLCDYAHSLNKKVYITVNIIPHDEDLKGLRRYLKALDKAGVDAVITSSMYIIRTALHYTPRMECHVSTQMSVSNIDAIKFYQELGCKRVVLSRETTLDKIKHIASNTNIDLEIFIHGGMCASYSGRCVLSNHFTNRDANRGGCAHSCRWNYDLYHNEDKINEEDTFFNIGSKDLVAGHFIKDLIDNNIKSLKIEGRMKSAYYIACVIKTYRNLIDKYYQNHELKESDYLEFDREIMKAENRLLGCGFYKGIAGTNEGLYDTRSENPTQIYIGRVLEYDKEKKLALIEERNYFERGMEAEIIGPNIDNYHFTIEKIIDYETKEALDVARHPLQLLYLKIDIELHPDDMIRLVS